MQNFKLHGLKINFEKLFIPYPLSFALILTCRTHQTPLKSSILMVFGFSHFAHDNLCVLMNRIIDNMNLNFQNNEVFIRVCQTLYLNSEGYFNEKKNQ